MSLYKRGPYWHYEFMVAGRRYRGSTKQATRAKAEKIQAMEIAKAQDGSQSVVRRVPTLAEFKPRFFKAVEESRLKQHSKRYYQEGWKILNKTHLPKLRINQIDNEQLEAAKLSGSNSKMNQAIATLRRMLGRAEEWKVLPRAPKLHRQPATHREAVISQEQEALLLVHMTAAMRVAYLMMKDGGMRRDEVARAKVELIDWNERTYFIEDGKTPKARRYIFLGKRLFEALFVHVKDRKSGWMFPAKRSKSGHVHPDSLSHWFESARNSAGLSASIVLYSARHTFGTVVYQRTGNLKLVMDTMGHTNVKTAMIYQHPEMQLGRDAIDAHNETPTKVPTGQKDRLPESSQVLQ